VNYGELLLLLFLVLTALYSFMLFSAVAVFTVDCCWCQAKDPPASLDEQDMLDACRLTETRLMCIEEERRLTVMATHGKGLKRTWLLLSSSLFTVHCSLFTVHCSLFTVHCSLFTVHCSLFTVHCSLFTVH
jgi:hypothetical protein